MRVAQYGVPAAPDGGAAQLVAFYFGPGQGGTVDANIARWSAQFSTSEGGPVKPRISRFVAGELPVTLAEFQGHYARTMGRAPKGAAIADQSLLAAVVEAQNGSIFVQLHGPTPTVLRNRAAFEQFLRGLRPAARNP